MITLQIYIFFIFYCQDEIIRQETLNCVERGLMMIHVRDEINMTFETYQKLYESAIGYGIRKVLLVCGN